MKTKKLIENFKNQKVDLNIIGSGPNATYVISGSYINLFTGCTVIKRDIEDGSTLINTWNCR